MPTTLDVTLVRTPDICGGRLRIDGTRMTVNQIVALHQQGLSAQQIVEQYPQRTLSEIFAVLAWYHEHKSQFDEELAAEAQRDESIIGSSNSEWRWPATSSRASTLPSSHSAAEQSSVEVSIARIFKGRNAKGKIGFYTLRRPREDDKRALSRYSSLLAPRSWLFTLHSNNPCAYTKLPPFPAMASAPK